MSDGRAKKDWQKRECLNQILAVWIENPHLRLGQLITNAIGTGGAGVFNYEDIPLT